MSKEQDWKKEIREIVKSELQSWKPKTPESPPSSKEPEHTHFKEGDPICPDCYPAVEKAVISKLKEEKPLFCVNCGEWVNEDETEECPNCGETNAKKRR